MPRQLRKTLRDHPRPGDLYHCTMVLRRIEAKHSRLRVQEREKVTPREIEFEENLKKEYKDALDNLRLAAGNLTWTQAFGLPHWAGSRPYSGQEEVNGKPDTRGLKALAFMKRIFLREGQRHCLKRALEECGAGGARESPPSSP